jgi:hypothetical protein
VRERSWDLPLGVLEVGKPAGGSRLLDAFLAAALVTILLVGSAIVSCRLGVGFGLDS